MTNMTRALLVLSAFSGMLASRSQSRADSIIYFNEGLNQALPNPRGLYNFDTVTGISTFRTALSDTTSRFFAFTFRSSDGAVFGLTLDGKLTQVNPYTGLVTVIGNTGITEATGLTIRPTDGAFFATGHDGTLYSINPLTGAASALGTTFVQGTYGLVASSTGQLFDFNAFGTLYRVDATNGNATIVAPMGGVTVDQVEGATFTPSGKLLIVDYDYNLVIQVDPLTNNDTVVGKAEGTGLLGVFSVPEPTSALRLGFGLAVVAAVIRSRKPARAVRADGIKRH